MKKNKITILGSDFYYELRSDSSEYGDSYWTVFYQDTVTRTRKKYVFFGELIKWEEPQVLFSINFYITDPNYTKGELRDILENKVELLSRSYEISKGDLI